MAGRQVAWSETAKVTVRWVRKDKIKFKIKRGWVDGSIGRQVDGSTGRRVRDLHDDRSLGKEL